MVMFMCLCQITENIDISIISKTFGICRPIVPASTTCLLVDVCMKTNKTLAQVQNSNTFILQLYILSHIKNKNKEQSEIYTVHRIK